MKTFHIFLLNYDSLNLIALGWSSQAVARLARLGGEVLLPFMDTVTAQVYTMCASHVTTYQINMNTQN